MYMAPECLDGWPVDYRSDMFSLGVLLEGMAGIAFWEISTHK